MAKQDLIDFKVSGTWLNYYHETGLTPRCDGSIHTKTARELREEIKRLQIMRDQIKISDEEFWMQKTQDQALQRLLDQKERTIHALRQELDTLRQRQPSNKQTTHLGIKA